MSDISKLTKQAESIYLRVNQSFKFVIQTDPSVAREDSAASLLSLVSEVRHILQEMNKCSVEERTKHFNITFNAVVYISDIASLLKKSNYSFECVEEIVDCIVAMEANVILQDVKYLDKRTKLYLDACHVYEENYMLEPAVALLEGALRKYQELRDIHEMDPPIPSHADQILRNNTNIIKIMLIKYSIQGNSLSPNQWRKKVDEEFGDNTELKLISLTECLKTETRRQSNIFQKNQNASVSKTYKDALLQAGFDMVKPHLQTLTKAIKEQKQRIEREVEFANTRTVNKQELTQKQLTSNEIKKKRELEEKYTKESEFRKASASFPFEYHAEMLHYAFEMGNTQMFNSLASLALLREQCRRIEVPYISDIGIIASSTKHPNIPNGYDKAPIDLNQANLKAELKRLRKKNQSRKEETQPVPPPAALDTKKKGGKQVPKAPPPSKNADEPTEWELEQIKHKYVFMIISRTMSPEKAVFGVNVILGDEEQGPAGFIDTRRIIVPYMTEDMDANESAVKQYRGVKQSSHMAPYIILWHSKTALQDESEKKSAIVDVKPLIGSNPMMPPQWGYNKIPVDLRQVPQEFIKQSNHDYVYLTFKTDQQFHISSRHVKVLNALNCLQTNQQPASVSTVSHEKLLQLQIHYDLQCFESLFVVLQECLEGKLGQEYYMAKSDFLIHLTYHLWVKYLRNPFAQFDYVNEMRLNGQLVDYEYEVFREVLMKCKPIFLNGLKILNFIMVNNPKSDILLLSRLNIQLLKLLEEEQEYKSAADNGRACLQRIRTFRDVYLTRGVKGNRSKLLPFAVTCSNLKLRETMNSMKRKFKEQRNLIRKMKRIKARQVNRQEALNQEELAEEETEYLHFYKPNQVDEIVERIQSTHSQLISIVSAIELDIFNIFFRVSLKHAESVKKREGVSARGGELGQGLAASVKLKLSAPFGKNSSKNQQNLNELQTTLIQAQKLTAPKPELHWTEKRLIEEFQKNPYASVLLMANFAAKNSQSQEKKYYLKEALTYIQQCLQEEEKGCNSAVENAIFLLSTLWDDQIHPENSSSNIEPFSSLYNGTWAAQSHVPSQPILISKNSESISLKMPPFSPKKFGKMKKSVKYMSLYGKPSANGVDVSTNCDQLQGTGMKNRINEVVTVTSLKHNSVYCFAAAATNEQQEIEPIGKTSSDVLTSNPLPIPMLASYLAKVSYQINEFEIAESASRIVVEEYCNKTAFMTQDEQLNGLYTYQFREKALHSASLLQIRSIAESLYVLALCERRKLLQLKNSNRVCTPILFQQKQKVITNWLVLAALLNPSMTAPLSQILFLIPDEHITLKALSLSLIPQKWMTSRLRELGIKVMKKVMNWGLKNNQTSMARRIMYKWSERKWLLLGKIIKVEEETKDAKKGGKQPKNQQVKMVDKYCRILIQKSKGNFDCFEDSIAMTSEEYSDYVSMFVERAKQQITYFTQFVTNPPQQLQEMGALLNSKLELVELLKDPLSNANKISENSPNYLEYNCRLLRKALEAITINASDDYKTLLAKSEGLNPPTKLPQEIVISNQIKALIFQAIVNNIEWIPEAKNDLLTLQEKTGKDLSLSISIFSKYEQRMQTLNNSIIKMDNLAEKAKDFDYLNLWLAELYYLKATISIINMQTLNVKAPIKGRYDKPRLMNLDDLLKKIKETEIVDKEAISYTSEDLTALNKAFQYLCDAAYHSASVENWIKLMNVLRMAYNMLVKNLITPFYHRADCLWQKLTFLAFLSIKMLKDVWKMGFFSFKNRYTRKMNRTELKIISNKLQLPYESEQMIQAYRSQSFLPELDRSTTKDYWFDREPSLDLQVVSSLVAYAVQCLRIEQKFNLVINLTRDFCNATQHYYSLQFLPFMIESQQKLIHEVTLAVDIKNQELNEITDAYTKKKANRKGERKQKLDKTKPQFELQFEMAQKAIHQSMELLINNKNFLQAQNRASQAIISQIKRDTSKTVLRQREQRKYMLEFGDDEEHMFQNYGEDTRLAKNRKNAVKDIIEQYEQIYRQLKSNKTSKDPIAQIQNRNDVGDLYFAAGQPEKAEEFWGDALATIFKTVHPVQNYLGIYEANKAHLLSNIGQKQVIFAVGLLYKISMFASFKKLYAQYNCTEFACILGQALFEEDGRHPQTLLAHSSYRLAKLSERDPFEDQNVINLSVLLPALEYFALKAIDQGLCVQSLPLINLLEYVAIDVVKNTELAARAKLIKVIALAKCGQIHEAMTYLAKVAMEKDFPNIWVEFSENMKRQIGENWCLGSIAYDNSKSWDTAANKQAIQWLKKLSVKPQLALRYGLLNPIIFEYAKSLVLCTIYQFQIYDNADLNAIRIQNVNEAELMLRACLRKLGVLEEHYCNLEEVQKAGIKAKKNELNEQVEKQLNEAKTKLTNYLKSNGIPQALIPVHEKQKSTSLKRVSRLEFIARIRHCLYQTYQSRKLSKSSFYVLKNGCANLHRYSYGGRNVENGIDSEIQIVQSQPTGKKEDKKGGKKEEEKLEPPKNQINWQQQRMQQQKAEQSQQTRTALNAFWSLKLLYEMGKLMFRQNRFTTCIKVFSQLMDQCKKLEDRYYLLFSRGFILRSKLRMGDCQTQKLQNLIAEAEDRQYWSADLLELVMDTGEIVGGEKSIELYAKGRVIAGRMWKQHGMELTLSGIGLQNPQRMYTNKQELSAEQEEEIRRKGAKKADKKGGKDDKKAAKKQDPKKKKQETKAEYKVEPLSTIDTYNLLDEQKKLFQRYMFKPHPNYHSNNIYTLFPLTYIKCYFWHLLATIKHRFTSALLTGETKTVEKLIKVIGSYPESGYYYELLANFILAELNKNSFVEKLKVLLRDSSHSKELTSPANDLPRNREMIKLPTYSGFLYQNRYLLIEAEAKYKIILQLIWNSCILLPNNLRVDDILWKAAENQLYLVEYRGRSVPKFVAAEVSAQAHEEDQIEYLNQLQEAALDLEFSIKAMGIIEQLKNNYSELGSKPLEPNVKIDEDIVSQINQIDNEFKAMYPKFLTDNLKPKSGISSAQIITFFTKTHRQAQIMTFSNSHLQSLLLRCHQILLAALPTYKDKCVLTNTDYVPKKSINEPRIAKQTFYFKSKCSDSEDTHNYLYILGGVEERDEIYYGKVDIHDSQVSKLSEQFYRIRSKILSSEKKSQAVRERDNRIYAKEISDTLLQFAKQFDSKLQEMPIQTEFTKQHLSILILMLQSSGVKQSNRDILKLLRVLHENKYRIAK